MDKRKLAEELRKMFAIYEHQRIFIPLSAKDYQEAQKNAIQIYLNNPVFHATVDHLADKVINIIESCEK